MTPDFVRRFAPELSLEGGSSTAPAGLVSEQYDAQGMPLPFIQSGGQRQYFGTPGPDGLRGRMSDAPAASAPPSPFGTRLADEPVLAGLRGTQEPSTGSFPSVYTEPPNPLAPSRGRPGNTASIPPMPLSPDTPRVENQISAGLNAERTGNNVADAASFERTLASLTNPQDMTLGDMLSHFNFQLPSFLPTRSNELRPRINEQEPDHIEVPEVDPRSDVSYSGTGTGTQLNVATPEHLAEFNWRMRGVLPAWRDVGNQVRSQAEQTSLFRRGLAPSLNSAHLRGTAIDIPPEHIGGLSGRENVAQVERLLRAAGYTDIYVQWESGHGHNQGTGPHYHVQVPRRTRHR